MGLFGFKIYDVHYTHSYSTLGALESVQIEDKDWKKFDFSFDTEFMKIAAFRADAIFDSDGTPTGCTRVYMSDGGIFFAVNKFETFEKNYKEVYLEEVKNDLLSRIKDELPIDDKVTE